MMMTEILTAYQATYLVARSATVHRCMLKGGAAVRLEELPASSAKVVFAVAESLGPELGLGTVGGRPRRIVQSGGKLMRELMSFEEFGRAVMTDWSEAARGIQDGDTLRQLDLAWKAACVDNPFAQWGRATSPAATDRMTEETDRGEGPKIRKWMDDGGAAVAAKVAAAADNVRVIAGSVFATCREPCWVVERNPVWAMEADHPDNLVWVRLGWTDEVGTGTPSAEETMCPWKVDGLSETRFAIHRRDDAVAFAQRLVAVPGSKLTGVRVTGAARVLDQSAVTYPDDTVALQVAAMSLLEAASFQLQVASREAVVSWHLLRDECEASGMVSQRRKPYSEQVTQQPVPIASDRLAAALGRAAAAWSIPIRETDVTGRWHETPFSARESSITSRGIRMPGVGAVARAAITAVGRWDSRPSDGREWASESVTSTGHGQVTAVEVTTLVAANRLAARLGTDLGGLVRRARDGAARAVAVFRDDAVIGLAALSRNGIQVHPASADPDACMKAARIAFAMPRARRQPVLQDDVGHDALFGATPGAVPGAA